MAQSSLLSCLVLGLFHSERSYQQSQLLEKEMKNQTYLFQTQYTINKSSLTMIKVVLCYIYPHKTHTLNNQFFIQGFISKSKITLTLKTKYCFLYMLWTCQRLNSVKREKRKQKEKLIPITHVVRPTTFVNDKTDVPVICPAD